MPLRDNLFIKYVEIVYSLCHKVFWQDRSFFEPPSPNQDETTRKWFKVRGTEIAPIELNEFSYIVQTYCNFFIGRGLPSWQLLTIKWADITITINFISQFKIQESKQS